MTIEEYLFDVKRVYYQLSVIVAGEQLLVTGKTDRRTDIHDSRNSLGRIRFATLSIPAATEVTKIDSDHAMIDFGGAHLSIWPLEEEEKNA